MREWRDLKFNIDSERQIFFEKLFHGKFSIASLSFSQKPAETKLRKNYFVFLFFKFCFDV